MTEVEIAKTLQSALAAHSLKVSVKRRQGHVYVRLARPATVSVSYPDLMHLVEEQLRSLGIPGLEELTVYGRILDSQDYEWQQRVQLVFPEDELASEATIFMPRDDFGLQKVRSTLPSRRDPEPPPFTLPPQPSPRPVIVPPEDPPPLLWQQPWFWGGVIAAFILIVGLLLAGIL